MSFQQAFINTSYRMPDAAVAASRQLWLAGLGAAVVSSNWLRNEAGTTFRTLVKEGSVVESRAMRVMQHEVSSSVRRAGAAWNGTRANVVDTLRAITSAARQRIDALPRVVVQSPQTARVATPRKPTAAKQPAKKATRRTRAVKRTGR